jgi:pimeloyl-ACP methyl ester carboxylesterase
MATKTPLLLLPGLLCDEALWQFQIKALKGIADCSVADLAHHESMPALARTALAKAPAKFALAGLSMGGYVAFEIIRQAPERVLKLCLLDTSARPDTTDQKERRQLLMSMSRAGQFKGVTPRLLPMLVHSSRLKDDKLTDIIYGMAGRLGREGFIRQQTAIMDRADSRPLLPTIKIPVQIIGGRQDELTPPEVMREIADGIRGAQIDIIDNCGHLSALEQPDKVNALMTKWLSI